MTIWWADGVIIDALVVEILKISTEFMESILVAWPKVVDILPAFFFSLNHGIEQIKE